MLVRLTDEGRASVDAALADLLEAERRILDGLSAEQHEQVAVVLRQLLLPYDL